MHRQLASNFSATVSSVLENDGKMKKRICLLNSLSLPGVLFSAALVFGGCGDPDFPRDSRIEGNEMGSLLLPPAQSSMALQTLCPDGDTLPGIDVSYYQGVIDWEAVANDGIVFAIIRVSDGPTHIDTQFQNNWQGAKENGLIRGAYQFFRSNRDPIEQADHLLEIMGPLEAGDLPPVIDLESTDGVSTSERIANVRAWIDRVETAIGMPPIIYTGGYFWNSHMSTTEFSDHPLWHAGYTGGNCPSTVADEWEDWTFWQYTSSGSVAGISGNVDRNRFNGDLDDLMALTLDGNLCGNGVCGVTESHETCPADCPGCAELPAEGGIVSENSPCFLGGGPAAYLRSVNDAGEGGRLIWTHTTDNDDESNFAQWQVMVSEPGYYRVEAYTAQAYAESQQAQYVVVHDGQQDAFVVDQSQSEGWTLVANRVWFTGTEEEFVHLGDNTGEPVEEQIQIVFDAIRLTRSEFQDDTDTSSGDGSSSTSEEEENAENIAPTTPDEIISGPFPQPTTDENDLDAENAISPWSATADAPDSCGGCQSSADLSAMWILGLGLLCRRRQYRPLP